MKQVSAKWTYDNRDAITVNGAETFAEAWDIANEFLYEEVGEDAPYALPLDAGYEDFTPVEEGREIIIPVKIY